MAGRLPGPRVPVPPPLCSDIPGTWAFSTMSDRIRTDILARIFRENDFSPAALSRLRVLDEELEKADSTPLTAIEQDGGPDVSHWNSVILTSVLEGNETWLSAPWAVSEFYFYRRVMSAIDYFNHPMDPFSSQKLLGLTSSLSSFKPLARRVNATLSSARSNLIQDFERFVLTALWGNRMDLSIWPVGSSGAEQGKKENEHGVEEVLLAGGDFILANDCKKLADYVSSQPRNSRYDIIVDNAGFELFCDLCLADYLVSSGLAGNVFVHLKSHPTFVSDAMAKDVMETIDYLCNLESVPECSSLGSRWRSHVDSGKWLLVEDYFWVQPCPMWKMPGHLFAQLSTSQLCFVKGDANYRRLLGDRSWQLDTPFEDVLCYFPGPVCALRTLKAELGCGMPKAITDRVASQDETWLVSGKYGVVQFLDTKTLTENAPSSNEG